MVGNAGGEAGTEYFMERAWVYYGQRRVKEKVHENKMEKGKREKETEKEQK